jgi:hypothetical protein
MKVKTIKAGQEGTAVALAKLKLRSCTRENHQRDISRMQIEIRAEARGKEAPGAAVY